MASGSTSIERWHQAISFADVAVRHHKVSVSGWSMALAFRDVQFEVELGTEISPFTLTWAFNSVSFLNDPAVEISPFSLSFTFREIDFDLTTSPDPTIILPAELDYSGVSLPARYDLETL